MFSIHLCNLRDVWKQSRHLGKSMVQKSNWKCKVFDEKVSRGEEEAFLNSNLQQQL